MQKNVLVENYSPIYSSSILLVETHFTCSSIGVLNLEERGSNKFVSSNIIPEYLLQASGMRRLSTNFSGDLLGIPVLNWRSINI